MGVVRGAHPKHDYQDVILSVEPSILNQKKAQLIEKAYVESSFRIEYDTFESEKKKSVQESSLDWYQQYEQHIQSLQKVQQEHQMSIYNDFVTYHTSNQYHG